MKALYYPVVSPPLTEKAGGGNKQKVVWASSYEEAIKLFEANDIKNLRSAGRVSVWPMMQDQSHLVEAHEMQDGNPVFYLSR